MSLPVRRVPDIGETFTKTDRGGSNRFRVDGWYKTATPPKFRADKTPLGNIIDSILFETTQEVGPDRRKLVACLRHEAEYISGCGVSGVLVRVADCVVDGRVSWTESVIEEQRQEAIRRVGQVIF